MVVDRAHGAAYQIAPKVFHELGAEVIAIGCSPDGTRTSTEDVGATHPQALVAAVSWPTRPITALPWMAMPIACKWSNGQGACTTGMSCCT